MSRRASRSAAEASYQIIPGSYKVHYSSLPLEQSVVSFLYFHLSNEEGKPSNNVHTNCDAVSEQNTTDRSLSTTIPTDVSIP